jgi:DNA-directed RNA polymerase specialized sigma24 family protein
MGKQWNPHIPNEELWRAVQLAGRYFARRISREQRDEVLAELQYRILKRVKNFKPASVTLESYCLYSARFAWIDYWRQESKRVRFQSLDAIEPGNDPLLSEEHPGFREVEERLDMESQGDGQDGCE